MSSLPIPPVQGVPDDLIRILNQRLRDLSTSSSGVSSQDLADLQSQIENLARRLAASSGGGATYVSPGYGYVMDTPDGTGTIVPDATAVCHQVTLGVSMIANPTNTTEGKPLIFLLLRPGIGSYSEPAWGPAYSGIPSYQVPPSGPAITIVYFVTAPGGNVVCIDLWQPDSTNTLAIIPDTSQSTVGHIDFQDKTGHGYVSVQAPEVASASYALELPADIPPNDTPIPVLATLGSGKVTLSFGTYSPGSGATDASVTVSGGLIGNSAAFSAGGAISMPANTSKIARFQVDLVGPGSSTATIVSVLVDGPFTASGTAPYALPLTYREITPASYTVKFSALDDGWNVISTLEKPVSVDAAAAVSVTASEVSGGRVVESSGLIDTFLQFTPIFTGGPVVLATWYNRGDGLGWRDQGWYRVDTSGTLTKIPNTIPAPSASTGSWQVAIYVIHGADGYVPAFEYPLTSLPTGARTSSAFSVPTVGAPASSIASSASIGTISYVLAGTNWLWGWASMSCQIDLTNIHFWAFRATVQKGHYSGSTWVPASDIEGTEREFARVQRDGTGNCTLSSTGLVSVPNNMNWLAPPVTLVGGGSNPDIIYKFKFYVGDAEGVPENGTGSPTWTLQACWPSSATSHDVTVSKSDASITSGQVASLPTALVKSSVQSFLGVEIEIGIDGNLHIANGGITGVMIDDATIISAKIYNLDVAKLIGTAATFSSGITFNGPSGVSLALSGVGIALTAGSHTTLIEAGGMSTPFLVVGTSLVSPDGDIQMGRIFCESTAWLSGDTYFGYSSSGNPGAVDASGNATFASFKITAGVYGISSSGAGTFSNIYSASAVNSLLSGKVDTSALSSYLTTSAASSTYLTIATAASTYMPAAGPSWGLTTSCYIVAADGWWHSLGWTKGILSTLSEGT